MSTGPTSGQLLRLSRAAHAAGRRQRFNAALRRLVRLLPIPLAYAVVARALVQWLEPGADAMRWAWLGFFVACLAPVAGVLAVWLARRSPHAGALALDRHHQSADRITNALEFAKLSASEQSPFMQAAIADALLAVERPNVAAAVPLELPRSAAWSVALVFLVVAASFITPHPPAAPELAPAVLAPVDPVVLAADDLSFLRESLEEFKPSSDSPELTQAVTDFNRLVEEMAERKLDRRELFRRLTEIERSLATGPEADEALDAGLKDLAEQLDKSPLSRPIADALKEKRLEDAEKAMRELAERLARKDTPIDPAELERLRKALDAASTEADGRVERLEQMRREMEAEQRRLLQKKNAKDPATPEQKAEQERQKRRLEKLDRDIADAKRSQEKMSELDKELAKAAQELMRELGKSAEHLKSGAEDMNRMARQKMSEEEKRQLKQKLEELREMLRQGGANKEQHLKRMQQFAERARGEKGGGKDGQGQQGKGGQNGPPRLTLGPGGTPLPLPGSGGPSPSGDKPGGGDGPSGGTEAGAGSSPDMKGKATDLDGKTEDVTAAAVDTGQGAASSEVVFGAAEQGFSGARYQKVYTQYRTVAEDVLEQDTIPAGYEFYVRRYFQLIRPRQAE
jgi:septal ring factor EnvC (AmiA/AmiB activator)